MKLKIIQQIESQTYTRLSQIIDLEDPADVVRNRYNNSYLLHEGQLVALNVSASESLVRIEFDEKTCTSLQYLNLSENKNLRSVVFAAALPNLQYLDLSECKLEGLILPAGCDRLKKAWLQKSELQTMTFLGPCQELLLLDLSGNRLEEFTLPGGFDSLAYLYMAENPLVRLTFAYQEGVPGSDNLLYETPLPQLETLHLGRNSLGHVPENIVFSDKLKALYLAGNTPKNIPKVLLGEWEFLNLESCLEDVRTWFTEIRTCPHKKNHAVKLMLTGNGNVGKSTLACSMRHGACTHNHETTHGILIDTLEREDITYNIWDFGGQEVYHGTHRLFMSSEALQVIVFDTSSEGNARNFIQEKDRVNNKLIRSHPIEYWYETAREQSPDSQFFIVQNKKSQTESIDARASRYANNKATFTPLNAKTGEDVDDLLYFLKKNACKLPDYGMTMPESWLKVRQFFIDNLHVESSRKIIKEEDFDGLCDDNGVMEKARPLLFKYLHHNGFLYSHQNLGGNIIADQRWALEAIYKPYDRKAPHYEVFFDLKGKIRVGHLFSVFGDGYKEEEKWLFLDFMKSCGLCFQLNDKPWRESKGESDIYVFPEFLPDTKPDAVNAVWQRARDVHVLRYRLPWLNYYVIQSFITALGRKTEPEYFWRYGIHVLTQDGWFKVELDYNERALLIHIESKAMAVWLPSILDELKVDHGKNGWEISSAGAAFTPFALEELPEYHRHKMAETRMLQQGGEKVEKRLPERLEDRHQLLDRQVLLFLAANPTDDKLSLRNEHSHIAEKLSERNIKDRFEIIPRFDTSPERMIETIFDFTPTIVHFAAHGKEVNPDTKRGGGLVFHTDDFQGRIEIDADKLSKIFCRIKEETPNLKIVFLSACYSEPQAVAISMHDIYTIGVNDELSSRAARLFAAAFYRQYALSLDVQNAFKKGLLSGLAEDSNIETLIHLFFNGQMIAV